MIKLLGVGIVLVGLLAAAPPLGLLGLGIFAALAWKSWPRRR